MFGLKKKRTWVIGGVVAALIGTTAFATMHKHSPEKRVERVTERVVGKLDLNTSQEEAFSKVAKSYVSIRGTAPEFMLDLSGKLKDLAKDETLTVEEVNLLREEIKAEFDRRTDILVPEFVAFYNTLNDDQRAKVTERLDKMSNRLERRIEKRAERKKANQAE
jgi:hypothetical protein